MERRGAVYTANPGLPLPEITKRVAKLWQELSAEEKEVRLSERVADGLGCSASRLSSTQAHSLPPCQPHVTLPPPCPTDWLLLVAYLCVELFGQLDVLGKRGVSFLLALSLGLPHSLQRGKARQSGNSNGGCRGTGRACALTVSPSQTQAW